MLSHCDRVGSKGTPYSGFSRFLPRVLLCNRDWSGEWPGIRTRLLSARVPPPPRSRQSRRSPAYGTDGVHIPLSSGAMGFGVVPSAITFGKARDALRAHMSNGETGRNAYISLTHVPMEEIIAFRRVGHHTSPMFLRRVGCPPLLRRESCSWRSWRLVQSRLLCTLAVAPNGQLGSLGVDWWIIRRGSVTCPPPIRRPRPHHRHPF
ncbi:hypothetical protein BXZ70DRAFT_485001 [Cristinia sonorae]|uniref:Uncharacterized protein n=1 Tax=Cristinia sonorae TaxID=1940300 RepID=A0A8K0UH13_9AGAR|nr:hypothetical protein BXZ70DRAFT_485001 [Cristinia sonorae]